MSTEINIKKRIDIQEEGVSLTPDVNSINFVGAGVTASTVGDDVTVNIPGSIGATVYYMNQTVTQTPYKEFSSTPTSAVEQVIPATVAGGATTTIASYQTASGVPNTTVIPAGLWQFFLHFNAGSAGQNWIIRPYVYKRDLGGIETLIFTPDPEIVTNMSTTTTMYTSDGVFPTTTLLTTDRIVVKIDMQNTTGVSQTVNFRTEGSQHYSVATTTLNQAVPTGGVTSVTGTAPVVSSGGTTPAISMAQANGSTNGYLSSTDWNTFNTKNVLFADLATTEVLKPCTYNNGTSGVGATLTGNSNGQLATISYTGQIDGVNTVLNQVILVRSQASAIQNGLYIVTQLGDASNPFILTRTTNADATTELYPLQVNINSGTFANYLFFQKTANPTIGVSNITFTNSFAGVTQTQVVFVDTVTSTALPSCTYTSGTNTGLPGSGAKLTATSNGAIGTINGITLALGNRVLVKDEVDQATNGDYSVIQIGTGSTPFILQRVTVYGSDFNRYIKEWKVNNSSSTKFGLRYNVDLSGITNTNVGVSALVFQEVQVVPTTRSITINGTTQDLSADRTFTISAGITAVPQTDLIYVDAVLGADDATSGRGNIDKPYATVEYVLANTINTGTVTGDTTSGSATLTNVSSTTNIKVGQYITGTNIPYNSIVISKTSNTIVLSQKATGNGLTLTLTWWTPKTIKINGNILATSNWFKPCFWFDAPNANVTWGNFILFYKAAACLVPEVISLGNLYGNNASSQFMYSIIASGQDIFITLKNYYSIGTGAQLYIQDYDVTYRNFYLTCISFDARFGSIGSLRGTGLTQLNGYFYGLLGGLKVYTSSVINGSIETPASIYALDIQYGSHEINAQIKGSFKTTVAGQVQSLNLNGTVVGTTVYLGNASQYYQGCNVNGNIECTDLYITQNYNTNINGRVKGNITHDSGSLVVQGWYGGNYSGTGTNTKSYITAYGVFSQTNWPGNITLASGCQLTWYGGVDFSVSGGYSFPQISVASTCTLYVIGKLMGDITSLAGTIQVASSGYLWIIKKTVAITGTLSNFGGTIELTRNGYGNTTESATSTPTIDISTGVYQQDGGTLFCTNADSKSGLIRKTASGGKVILRGQSYLKVANGLAPLQILSNTGTAQDVLDFSMLGNGAIGFRLADTFSDTTYGTAYAPTY